MMTFSRHIAMLLLVLLLASHVSPAEGAAMSIPWHTDLQQGINAAQQTNKAILLDFWADWCTPCKVMDTEVYPDESVSTAMKSVVPVRIDFDKSKALTRRYSVEGVPTLLLTDSYGNELFRFTGLLGAQAMVDLLKAFPRDVSGINRFAKRLSEDGDDFAALRGMATEARAGGFYRSSNEVPRQGAAGEGRPGDQG